MHSRGYVEACFDRREQRSHPGLRNVAAAVGDADDHRPRAPRARLGRCQVRKPEVDASRQQPQLPDAVLTAPVPDPEGGLGRQLVLYVAEKEQVGPRDVDDHADQPQKPPSDGCTVLPT